LRITITLTGSTQRWSKSSKRRIVNTESRLQLSLKSSRIKRRRAMRSPRYRLSLRNAMMSCRRSLSWRRRPSKIPASNLSPYSWYSRSSERPLSSRSRRTRNLNSILSTMKGCLMNIRGPKCNSSKELTNLNSTRTPCRANTTGNLSRSVLNATSKRWLTNDFRVSWQNLKIISSPPRTASKAMKIKSRISLKSLRTRASVTSMRWMRFTISREATRTRS